METRYVSVTDTAKLIRAQLKRNYPGVKFSVRSAKYAGGASIDIYWTDGPTEADVDSTVAGFRGGRFDGMIDMAYSASSWLEEDGSAHVAWSPGTGGQRGSNPEEIGAPNSMSAELVHFHADYVMCHRTSSPEMIERCATTATPNGTFASANYDRCDGCGDWQRGADCPCFVVKALDRGTERIYFVCSPTCGGRIVARHTDERLVPVVEPVTGPAWAGGVAWA